MKQARPPTSALLESQLMPPLSFAEARALVIDKVRHSRRLPAVESVDLAAADGRVLAADVEADRDYPPLDRSVRDGFAVRAADVPGTLTVVGEVRAGERFSGVVKAGQAVEVMTGAPVPDGADAVVMVEHVRVAAGSVTVDQPVARGQNMSPRGGDAVTGGVVLRAGRLIGFPEVAVLATVGLSRVPVYRRPRVAVLATGDEILTSNQSRWRTRFATPMRGRWPSRCGARAANRWCCRPRATRPGRRPTLSPRACRLICC